MRVYRWQEDWRLVSCAIAVLLLLYSVPEYRGDGFYTFLRVYVSGLAAILAITFGIKRQAIWLVAAIIVAVLYNPFIPIAIDENCDSSWGCSSSFSGEGATFNLITAVGFTAVAISGLVASLNTRRVRQPQSNGQEQIAAMHAQAPATGNNEVPFPTPGADPEESDDEVETSNRPSFLPIGLINVLLLAAYGLAVRTATVGPEISSSAELVFQYMVSFWPALILYGISFTFLRLKRGRSGAKSKTHLYSAAITGLIVTLLSFGTWYGSQ